MESLIYTITSRDNPRVKEFVRNRDDLFIFEGLKLARDVLQMVPVVDLLVMVQKTGLQPRPPGGLVRETWLVSEPVMARLSGLHTPPEALAVLRQIPPCGRDFFSLPIILGLDAVQDPGNAGTIMRTAAAFGNAAMGFCGAGVRPTNEKFIRAAQTALLSVPYRQFQHPNELIREGLGREYHVYVTGARPQPRDIPFSRVKRPSLILMGSEGAGLPADLLDTFPQIRLAIRENVESLNVAIAASLILYERCGRDTST